MLVKASVPFDNRTSEWKYVVLIFRANIRKCFHLNPKFLQ